MSRLPRVVSALLVAASGGVVLYLVCPWLGADSAFFRLLFLVSSFSYVGGLAAAFHAAFGPLPEGENHVQ